MTQPDQDRRSIRTRQALIDALIKLMSSKPYSAITIKDIVRQANVGRSTFYAHYQTKDGLLLGGLGRVFDMVAQHLVLSETGRSVRMDTAWLFEHARGHEELYRTLTWGAGFKLLIQEGHAALSAKLLERLSQLLPAEREPSVPLSVLSYEMAGSLLILLKWWLDNRMPCSPDRMDEIFQLLVMPGIQDTVESR